MANARQYFDNIQPTEFGWDNQETNTYTLVAQLDRKIEDEILEVYEPAQPLPGDASGISYFFSR